MQFAVKLSIVLHCLFCSFILCQNLLIVQVEKSVWVLEVLKKLSKLPLCNSLLFASVHASEIVLPAF